MGINLPIKENLAPRKTEVSIFPLRHHQLAKTTNGS